MNENNSSSSLDKLHNYKKWYKICLIIGILGLIDIATYQFIKARFDMQDEGVLSFAIIQFFGSILGEKGISIALIINLLTFRITLIYFLIAWILRSKLKKLEIALNSQ